MFSRKASPAMRLASSNQNILPKRKKSRENCRSAFAEHQIICARTITEKGSQFPGTMKEETDCLKRLKQQKKRQNLRSACFWKRSGRDSNPRAVARKLISSQPRYDLFDTAAIY